MPVALLGAAGSGSVVRLATQELAPIRVLARRTATASQIRSIARTNFCATSRTTASGNAAPQHLHLSNVCKGPSFPPRLRGAGSRHAPSEWPLGALIDYVRPFTERSGPATLAFLCSNQQRRSWQDLQGAAFETCDLHSLHRAAGVFAVQPLLVQRVTFRRNAELA